MKNFFDFVIHKAMHSNEFVGVVCAIASTVTAAFAFGLLMGAMFEYPRLGSSVFFASLWGYIYVIYRKDTRE